jgi:phage recombination protein Bet
MAQMDAPMPANTQLAPTPAAPHPRDTTEDDKARRKRSLLEETIEITVGQGLKRKLSCQTIYDLYVTPTKSGQLPPLRLVRQFLMMLQSRGLDPDIGDAFITGFDSHDGPQWQIITAYQALIRRAAQHEAYDGMESGVLTVPISDPAIEPTRRIGAYYNPLSDTLVGAWATVYRRDRSHPDEITIPLGAYDRGRATWKSMQSVMILKCARAAAIRQAFPEDCGDSFIEQEFAGSDSSEDTPPQVTLPQPLTVDDLLPKRKDR